MKRFRFYLPDSDMEHVERILSRKKAEAMTFPSPEKVKIFFDERVWSTEELGKGFHDAPKEQREAVLSELIWRITCFLDGSTTEVMGLNVYDLGHGFFTNRIEQDGQEIFVMVRGDEPVGS